MNDDTVFIKKVKGVCLLAL